MATDTKPSQQVFDVNLDFSSDDDDEVYVFEKKTEFKSPEVEVQHLNERGRHPVQDDEKGPIEQSVTSSSKATAGIKANSKRSRGAPPAQLDLNSEHFYCAGFVNKVFEEKSIHELRSYTQDLQEDVKALDSEMQMLVYENYNKFIAATDTIRQMKSHVGGMEEEIVRLNSSMQTIESQCQEMEKRFRPNREKIEKLVGVQRLLKRLQFLFDLPKRLEQCLELANLSAYTKAVEYFKKSVAVLEKHKDLKSFQKIHSEAERMIQEIRSKLKDDMVNPKLNAGDQISTAGLLRELGEPPEHLWFDVLKVRGRIFEGILQNLDIEMLSQPASTSELTTKAVVEEPLYEGFTVQKLYDGFITGFVSFTRCYKETFLDPYENQQQRSGTLSIFSKSTAALTKFTRELFAKYFRIVKVALSQENYLSILEKQLQEFYDDLANPATLVPAARLKDTAAEIVEHCIRAAMTKTFKKAEIKIQKSILNLLKDLSAPIPEEYLEILNPEPEEKPKEKQNSNSEIETTPEEKLETTTNPFRITPDSGDKPMENSEAGASIQKPSPSKDVRGTSGLNPFKTTQQFTPDLLKSTVSERSGEIRRIITGTLTELSQLTRDSQLVRFLDQDCMRFTFAEKIHHHMLDILRRMNEALTGGALRTAEGPVHDPIMHENGITLPLDEIPPLFLLALAKLSYAIGDTVIGGIVEDFIKFYITSKKNERQYRQEIPTLVEDCFWSASCLRLRYVQRMGRPLLDTLRAVDYELACNPLLEIKEDEDSKESDPLAEQKPRDEVLAVRECIKRMYKSLLAVYEQLQERKLDWRKIKPQMRLGVGNLGDRDIDRIFAARPRVFEKVFDEPSVIFFTILKLIAKGWSEAIRELRLNRIHLNIILADVFFLRGSCPTILRREQASDLEHLWDDVEGSARDRCYEV